MPDDKLTAEVIGPEKGLAHPAPLPRPRRPTPPSMFDGLVHPMPMETPAPPTVDEVSPRPTVEVLTPEEERQREQRKAAPRPDAILEKSPVKPSLIQHVEVNCEAFLGFLVALSRITPAGGPVLLSSVKMTYRPDRERGAKLYLEAASQAMWAVISMKAAGGDTEFSAMLPLERAISVLKYLRGEYTDLLIGMDEEQIHLGPLSLPFGGRVSDFPEAVPLLTAEARVIVPAYYLEELSARLPPALGGGLGSTTSSGIHIDFAEQVAVASDEERYHILKLPRMSVESRLARVLPPAVTVTVEFFRFLMAVVDRDWTGLQVNAEQLAASDEDFAIVARCSIENYADWRRVIRRHSGAWVVDKTALQGILQSAIDGGVEVVRLRFEAGKELAAVMWGTEVGEAFQKTIGARRYDGAPPMVTIDLSPVELFDAAEACKGGLIQLGFADQKHVNDQPATVQGEDADFLAVIPARSR